MRYVAVGRVSTDRQGHNLSKDVQFEAIHAYARAQLWECVGEFFDAASGSEKGLEDRDGLREALGRIRAKQADTLIMYDTSRIGREGSVIQDLIKSIYEAGGKLGVATERRVYASALEAQELLFWTGAVSQFEYIQIKKRTSRGKRKAFDMGSFIWKPLFGYRLVKKDKLKVLEPDPIESAQLEEIFKRVASGIQKIDVARFAQDEYGLEINQNRLLKFYRDLDVYTGGTKRMSITFDGEKYFRDVQFPRIISDELARAVRNNYQVKHRKQKQPTPYLGIVKCTCGGTGTSYVNSKRKDGSRRVQLCCSTVVRGRNRRSKGQDPGHVCKHSLSTALITEDLLSYLDGGFKPDTEAVSAAIEAQESELVRMDERLTELDKRRQMLLERITSFESLTNVVDVLDKELGKIKDEEDSLQGYRVTLLSRIREDKDRLGKYHDWSGNKSEIIRAIKNNEWNRANHLLNESGITIWIDFNHPEPRQTLEVQVY